MSVNDEATVLRCRICDHVQLHEDYVMHGSACVACGKNPVLSDLFTERRATGQDVALETALILGTLPDADRREG